jgi:hypothetical protein
VSPYFIASDYCHHVEMTHAMERHGRGDARIIPVILRPCDWQPMPFGKILGVPRDGLAITCWPDLYEAFLDVVKWIRAALRKLRLRCSSQSRIPATVWMLTRACARSSRSSRPRTSARALALASA